MLFKKYQSLGNDFIIIDSIKDNVALEVPEIKKLCDRHFGIGADGLIISKKTGNDLFEMIFYNPDGTVAEICGNGIRCFIKFLFDEKYIDNGELAVLTGAGIKKIKIEARAKIRITVDMGNAEFQPLKIPAKNNSAEEVKKFLNDKITLVEIVVLSVGNPHCVIFVDSLDNIDLDSWGRHIELMKCFPEKINVEFARIRSRSEIEAIVWERGAGRTLACGTGATAIAAAAQSIGLADNRISVELPGGDLDIVNDRGNLKLTGDATHVFSGDIEIKRHKES